MAESIRTALSGLQANQKRVEASAHNTANKSTDGFERQRIVARERATGGVKTRVDTVELSEAAQKISETVEGAQNNVDQVSEAADRIEARENFKSNARVIRAQDDMLDSLLDLEA